MNILNCEQGSKEWHQARSGLVTASMFSEIRKVIGGLTEQQQKYVFAIQSGNTEKEALEFAGYKSKPRAAVIDRALAGEKCGDYTQAAKDYAFRLAVERISGEPLDEGFSTWAMQRGNELEPAARLEHEKQYGLLIERAGFVFDGHFGASADGMIDNTGGSEYKCLIDPSRLRTVLIDRDIDQFTDQVQGCLWLTGRDWWHFALYCPALESIDKHLTVIEVKRDNDYIRDLEIDLKAFDAYVEECVQLIKDVDFIAPAVPEAA